MTLQVGVLRHELLRLEPLRREHARGLGQAALGDRSSFAWTEVPTPETVDGYVDGMLARAATGDALPFAQITPDDRVVGHTSFLGPRFWPGGGGLLAIEVGNTWLDPGVQGTAINTVSKLLLCTHAFEAWTAARVDIKTDARNARARAGILAVGATFEGILRNWQPSAAPGEQGLPRDTAMHSITAAEWPARKRMLQARIERRRSA